MKSKNTRYMKLFGVDDMLIGGAISGLGSLASGFLNWNSQEKNNEAQAKEAALNRDFQERMSSTAYQRGMTDMKLAGLNPILAYQKGGASSPSGSQAAFTAPKIEGNPLGEAVNSGMALARNRAEVANLVSQNANINADTALKQGQAVKTAAEREILTQNLSPAQREKMQADLDKEVLGSSAGSAARKAGTLAQEVSRTTDPLLNSAKKLSDTITPWKSYGVETTRSGSRWNSHGEENHYQDSTFTKRFRGW